MSSVARHSRGFTLVELVLVIVLVGVLSAVAIGRLAGPDVFKARAYSDQIMAALRMAQKTAIAQNRPVFVSLNVSSVAVCFNAACTSRVRAPGGNNDGSAPSLAACGGSAIHYCVGAPGGITLTAPVALPYTFYFDQNGRPFQSADPLGSDTSTFATLALTVVEGADTFNFTVERETGYVHQ